MESAFKMIDKPTIERVIETAYALLQTPGLKVYNDQALGLFHGAGANVEGRHGHRLYDEPEGGSAGHPGRSFGERAVTAAALI